MRRLTPPVVQQVEAQRLTYLGVDALSDLHRAVRRIERDALDGSLIEAGCALGGSAIVMASAKRLGRPLFVYDVFGQIPPPSDKDGPDVEERFAIIASGRSPGIGGDVYYGYESDLLTKVVDNFRAYGLEPAEQDIYFIQGLFEDTLKPKGPVALAHIDADWYESVRVCLERIAPSLVIGGRLVIDDYDSWSGCHRAVDDFLAINPHFRTETHARLHLVRQT